MTKPRTYLTDEVVVHNTKLGCKASRTPHWVAKLNRLMNRFISTYAHAARYEWWHNGDMAILYKGVKQGWRELTCFKEQEMYLMEYCIGINVPKDWLQPEERIFKHFKGFSNARYSMRKAEGKKFVKKIKSKQIIEPTNGSTKPYRRHCERGFRKPFFDNC